MKPRFSRFNRISFTNRFIVFTTLMLTVPFTATYAFAGNTWDGGGGDNNWGTGNNWNPDGAPTPGSGNDLFFAGITQLTSNNNYTAFDDWRDLTFNSGAGAFTLTGSSIDLFGKIENLSTNTQTINFTSIRLNSASVNEFNPVNGNITIGANVDTNGANQLKVFGNNGNTLTFGTGSIISGAGSVAINQNSNVIYQSAHTYIGDTFVNAGSLQFAQGGSANSSTIRIGNDAIANSPAATVSITDADGGTTVASTIVVRPSASGTVGTRTISGTNTSGTNTFSGTVALDQVATITSTNAGGTLAFTGGTLQLKTFGLLVNGAGNTTISNVINHTGGVGNQLTKAGTGTLTLSGANTFNGGSTVNAGILSVSTIGGASSNLGAGTFTLGGGTLRYTGASTAATGLVFGLTTATSSTIEVTSGATNMSVAGSTSGGTGSLTKTGAGKLTFTGNSSYTGATTVSAGELVLGAGGGGTLNFASATSVSSGATLSFGYSANSSFTNAAFTIGLNSGTLQHLGAGFLTLAGPVTVTGTSSIGVTNTGLSNQLFVDGGLSGSGTVNITNTGSATTGVSFRNAGGSFAGAVNVFGGQVAVGNNATPFINADLTLNSAATLHLGASAFAITASGASVKSLNGAGTVTSAGSATTLTVGTNNGTGSFGGSLVNGTGGILSLTKTGTGTQTLTSANSYTGSTFVTGGTLQLTTGGSISTANNIVVGNGVAAGTLTIAGGTAATSVGGNFGLTIGNGSNGTFNISSGSLTTNGIVTGNTAHTAQWTQTGGTVTLNGANGFFAGNVAGGVTQMDISGGSLVSSGSIMYLGARANTTLNLSNSAVATFASLRAGEFAATTNVINLGDGTNFSGGGNIAAGGTSGVLALNSLTTINGTVAVNFKGGTLKATGNSAAFLGATSVSVQDAGGIIDNTTFAITLGSTLAHGGVAAIDGGLVFKGSGTTTLNGANTYTGATAINAGTVKAGVVSVANTSGAFGKASAVTLANVAGATMDITGFNTEIGSLAGGGATGGNSTLGAATLTTGRDNTSTSYAGIISGTGGGFTKIGTGTQTLTGASTYTGATTVTAGVLAVNGSLANTTTTVQNTGTLQGSGTIGGSVTTQSGGTLAPGNSIESLGTGALTLANGSIYAYEMANNSTTGADLTFVTGDLNIGLITLNLTDTGSWAVNDRITLFSYTGALTGGIGQFDGTTRGLTVGSNVLADGEMFTNAGQAWIIDYNNSVEGTNYQTDSSGTFVTLIAIPEPNFAALLGGAGVILLLRRRRN